MVIKRAPMVYSVILRLRSPSKISFEEAKRENLAITLESPDNTLTIHPGHSPLEKRLPLAHYGTGNIRYCY